MRHALAAIALIIVWVLLLGSAAGIPWSAPLRPQRQLELNGAQFRPVIGAGVEDGSALGVGAIAADGNALQSLTPDVPIHADEVPVLDYRFEDFPRTLELVLVFRRADAPGDVQTAVLAWPGAGSATVDLRALTPAWRGDIVEFGFAEYATTQLVPASVAFQPFRLLRARLSSRSWSALLPALRSAWLGYRPWNLAAINAVAGAAGKVASLPGLLVAGALLSLLICAWLLRWNRRVLLRATLIAAALAWALLDLAWLDGLVAKHRLTDSLYADKSWQERARLQPDEDVAGFAQLTRQQLSGAAPQHLLVASDSTYTVLRLMYFLLPLNAAPLESALAGIGPLNWPADTVIVVCASRTWHYDDARAALSSDSRSIPVTPLFVSASLGVYRVRGGGG
jgi:hypothetical protein